MKYIVRPGDCLWSIAESQLHDPERWGEIARLNGLKPPYDLLIGQELLLPDKPPVVQRRVHARLVPSSPLVKAGGEFADPHRRADTVPGRAFLFVLADEILPSGKLVRKVLMVPIRDPRWVAANPEIFGLQATAPNAVVSLGEHALNEVRGKSPYISASTKPGGAPNIKGRPVYIDIAKAKAAGVTIHSTEEIIADLNRLVKKQPSLKYRVEKLKSVIQHVEGEVLLEGKVPASAVKSVSSMRLTRGLRFVQVVGVVLTVNDLRHAAIKSVKRNSPDPFYAESIRQTGGWGMALVGAKIGGEVGVWVGVVTGPWAIVIGAGCGLIFGTIGYWVADWMADHIDEN